MAVIGLTGGIGAGKSQAGEYFASLGATVIDADQLARDAIERGREGFDRVVNEFGDQILINGEIDRRALGEIVFADPQKRKALEAIIHPYVRDAFKTAVHKLREGQVLVYEIPLLVETNAMENFDFIITVEAPEDIRRSRLSARGLRASDIDRRISAQVSSDQRRKVADAVIDNDGDLDSLLRSCEKLWGEKISALK